MSGYGEFAAHYDRLTHNVDYPARAAYFADLLREYADGKVEGVLDLACGTGSLTFELARLGFDMVGTDGSLEMLSIAAAKAGEFEGPAPLFLCQDMDRLDLYGTVDGCVCALDSLNHLPDEAALRRVFARVALFLRPGGVFAFDLNTPYKHRVVLGGNCFVYDLDGLFCAWQNEPVGEDGEIRITLDFFARQADGLYRRSGEQFRERAFENELVVSALRDHGLELLARFGEDSREPPREDCERVVYVARRVEETA